MLRLLLLLILATLIARVFSRLLGGIKDGLRAPAPSARVPDRGVHMVRDPVCGTFVVPNQALMITQGSERIYFCSAECRGKYQARRG